MKKRGRKQKSMGGGAIDRFVPSTPKSLDLFQNVLNNVKEKFNFNVVHNLPINLKVFMANSNKNVKFFFVDVSRFTSLRFSDSITPSVSRFRRISPPLPLAFCTLWKVEQTTKRRKERKAWDPTSEKRKEKRLYAACLFFLSQTALIQDANTQRQERKTRTLHFGFGEAFFFSLFFLRFFVFLLSQCVYTAAMDICATGRK